VVELNHCNHSCEVTVSRRMPMLFAQTLWGHDFNLVGLSLGLLFLVVFCCVVFLVKRM